MAELSTVFKQLMSVSKCKKKRPELIYRIHTIWIMENVQYTLLTIHTVFTIKKSFTQSS